MDPAVTRAITQIPDDAWVGIKYPHAIYDQDEHRWVSDAEVAEIGLPGRPGALLRPAPLRTGLARFPRIRLKQAPKGSLAGQKD
jgi:hypothetical protein